MPRVEILCGCGWGHMSYQIEDGDIPQCPVCGHEFPQFEDCPDGLTLDGFGRCVPEEEMPFSHPDFTLVDSSAKNN